MLGCSRRIIFTPNTELKDELADTTVQITCYDRNGKEVKRVTSTDDLFSLEMLYYYQKQGRCKLLGVVVDRLSPHQASLYDTQLQHRP